jgi:hypothetical protein
MVAPVLLLSGGCSDRRPTATKPKTATVVDDPLAEIRDAARKEHSLESCKTIVAQLNEMLRRESPKPSPLSSADREMLTNHLNLTEDELAEVAREEFSPLDAHYLEECFLLHDALVSLDLDYSDTSDAAHLERAKRAFTWAMRQVWLRDFALPFAPPSYALKRGSGCPPERVAIALALFQVMGLDGCVVGQNPTAVVPQMWAVGLRLGKSVYLFDPRAGVPFLKPDGRSVYTLADVKSNPDLIKSQAEFFSPKVEAKDLAATSELSLVPALSAVAPRMQFLRSTLNLTPPLVCGMDPKTLATNFAQTGEKVSFGTPARGPGPRTRATALTPTLMLAYFLPPVEGGFDRSKPEEAAIEVFKRELVPGVPPPDVLRSGIVTGAPSLRLFNYFGGRFLTAALGENEPRQQILRGQFDEATNTLVDRQAKIELLLDRSAGDQSVDKEAAEWARQLASASATLTRAEREGRLNDPAAQEARNRIEVLNKSSEKVVIQIDRAAAPATTADQTYLLALCKHELAERMSHRRGVEPTKVRDDWRNAVSWWNKYLGNTASKPWIPAGQIAHAKKLQAEARREAERPVDASTNK